MRVLIAPDSFSGTLSAPEAASAIAEGWRSVAPETELDLAPVADGGPGFVDVLHTALGGDLRAVDVRGPWGGPRQRAEVLHVGSTAYVEAAQACRGALLGIAGPPGAALTASSVGVGESIVAAIAAGARAVVVGVGGTAVPDAGAGLLSALGAVADTPLDAGALGLDAMTRLDLGPARDRLAGIEVTCAHDADILLAGLFGIAKTEGAAMGLDEAEQMRLDARLEGFAAIAGRRGALSPGAGAGGGIGFGLGLLGARAESGIALVLAALELADRARRADLVITGEGRFDHASRAGKALHGVAAAAEAALRPCVVLAGEVLVGAREMRALGVESAYALTDEVGPERARQEAHTSLVATAARAARTWSR